MKLIVVFLSHLKLISFIQAITVTFEVYKTFKKNLPVLICNNVSEERYNSYIKDTISRGYPVDSWWTGYSNGYKVQGDPTKKYPINSYVRRASYTCKNLHGEPVKNDKNTLSDYCCTEWNDNDCKAESDNSFKFPFNNSNYYCKENV